MKNRQRLVGMSLSVLLAQIVGGLDLFLRLPVFRLGMYF